MNYCIRVDDIGWTTEKLPDKGLGLAQRFHAAMQGLPYLGGIIPACLDAEGLAWLASKPIGLTIAQHGYDHRKVDGVASEFRGLNLTGCRERINRGWRLFRDNRTSTEHMIPPFNAIEPDFPQACALEGIKCIWGEPSTWPTPPQPYSIGPIMFVPSWMPLYAATMWRMAAETAPLTETLPQTLSMPGRAVITLHITWEASKSESFNGMRWLVDQIKDRVISPNEFLTYCDK
jgi:hypothetical protein